MLGAYRGTIDYEGEEIAEALAEVERYFSGAEGNEPLAGQSVALVRGGAIESACLIRRWRERDGPLVGYVMSAADSKHRGLATFALEQAVDQLRRAGHSELHAFITAGNLPSEKLFQRAGFRRLPT
jgi:L-amino acid N-acyltransferase YncA